MTARADAGTPSAAAHPTPPSRLWRLAGGVTSAGTLAVLVAVLEAGRKWA